MLRRPGAAVFVATWSPCSSSSGEVAAGVAGATLRSGSTRNRGGAGATRVACGRRCLRSSVLRWAEFGFGEHDRVAGQAECGVAVDLRESGSVGAYLAGDVGRGVFFVADEYDGYTTQPGDGDFFSKCREGKCCAVIATQTYESFVAKLRNEHVAAQLLANLRTKIWLCAEDNYTARQAADLCGEIERWVMR